LEEADQSSWPKLLEVAAKAVLICYGIGYLIEVTYDSVFGVYDVELVRTRALFAGTSFLLLVATIHLVLKLGERFPYISDPWRSLSGRLERYERLPKSLTLLINLAAKLAVLVELTQLASFLYLLIYLPIDRIGYAQIHRQDLMSAMPEVFNRRFMLLAGLQSACVGTLFAAWRLIIPRWPRAAAGVTALLCVGYLVVTKLLGDVPMSLAVWLLAVLISMRTLQRYLDNEKSNTWRLMALLACLSSTAIYARLVYPRMLPWLGGPPRATVQITCDKSCSIDGKKMRLIEETNDGYYLVPYDGSQTDSTFVARSNVREVLFMASPKYLKPPDW
jgi:hypothetical protein